METILQIEEQATSRQAEPTKAFFARAPSLLSRSAYGPQLSTRIEWILEALMRAVPVAGHVDNLTPSIEGVGMDPTDRVDAMLAALEALRDLDGKLDTVRHEVREAIIRCARDHQSWKEIA